MSFKKRKEIKKLKHIRVSNRLVIDPQQTLVGLKKSLKFIKDISRQGGTILLVGNDPKFKSVMKQYAQDVKQPYVYRSWVNGLLSNDTILGAHLVRFGFKLERAPLSDWLKRNKAADFLMKYEGYMNHLKRPSLVVFLNTSQLSDALAEVSSLKIPSVGLATTSMDLNLLTYPIPSNDRSLKTISLFVELVKEAIREGQGERETILNYVKSHKQKKESKKRKLGQSFTVKKTWKTNHKKNWKKPKAKTSIIKKNGKK